MSRVERPGFADVRARQLLAAKDWTVRPGERNASVCVVERGERRQYGDSPAAIVQHLAVNRGLKKTSAA